jgi:hypothetical protein
MRLRVILAVLISGLFWVVSVVGTPAALALTQIKLDDLSYHECPAEIGTGAVTSDGTARAANCFIVTGKTQNNSGKIVYDADIFGRIYDADGNAILQNRARLGAIPEVPPGESTFELRISVAANQPLPLKLAQFKAAGFSSQVRHQLIEEEP